MELFKKSFSQNKIYGLTISILLLSSSILADQIRSVEESNNWLKLVEHAPVELPARVDKLDDLIRISLSNNSQLKIAYSEWKMRQEEVGTVVKLPDPSLTMGYYLEPVETAEGPQKLKLSIGQTLPWLSKTRAKTQQREAVADQVYELLSDTHLRIIQEVSTLWAEAAYLKQAIRLNNEKLNLAHDLEVVLTNRYKSGTVSHKQFTEAQTQTLEIADQEEHLNDKLFRIKVRLGTLLDLNGPVPSTFLPVMGIESYSSEQKNLIPSLHPRLARVDKMDEQVNARLRLARAELMPDIRLGVDYILTNKKVVNGAEIAGSGSDPLIASIGLSLPLWNWSKKRSAIQASQWQSKQIEALREKERLEIDQQKQLASSRLLEKERRFALLEDELIPRAEEIVNVMEQGYVSQKVDIDSLTTAKQHVLDLKLEAQETWRSVQGEKINLAYLRGE